MAKTSRHKILKSLYQEFQKSNLKQKCHLQTFLILMINWSTLQEVEQLRVYLQVHPVTKLKAKYNDPEKGYEKLYLRLNEFIDRFISDIGIVYIITNSKVKVDQFIDWGQQYKQISSVLYWCLGYIDIAIKTCEELWRIFFSQGHKIFHVIFEQIWLQVISINGFILECLQELIYNKFNKLNSFDLAFYEDFLWKQKKILEIQTKFKEHLFLQDLPLFKTWSPKEETVAQLLILRNTLREAIKQQREISYQNQEQLGQKVMATLLGLQCPNTNIKIAFVNPSEQLFVKYFNQKKDYIKD